MHFAARAASTVGRGACVRPCVSLFGQIKKSDRNSERKFSTNNKRGQVRREKLGASDPRLVGPFLAIREAFQRERGCGRVVGGKVGKWKFGLLSNWLATGGTSMVGPALALLFNRCYSLFSDLTVSK